MKKTSGKVGGNKDIYESITNFIYETSIHSKTPRSGLWLLGSGTQSVAEHLFHVAMIAYAMCYLEPKADKNRVIMMALFHDIGEGRTSDLNYVHQRYGRLAEINAVNDISQSVPFGAEILSFYKEEQARETLEAKLVKDADQLEWISKLREEEAKGNVKAKEWIRIACERLKTDVGKEFGKQLVKINPDAWWLDVNDKWFVDRNISDKDWKNGKLNKK